MAKRRHFILSHLPFKLEPHPPAADFRPRARASLQNIFCRITEKKDNGNTLIKVCSQRRSFANNAQSRTSSYFWKKVFHPFVHSMATDPILPPLGTIFRKNGISVPRCGVFRNATLPTDPVSAFQPAMEAEFFPGQPEATDPVVDGLVFERGASQLPADPSNHPGVLLRVGVQLFRDILDVFALDAGRYFRHPTALLPEDRNLEGSQPFRKNAPGVSPLGVKQCRPRLGPRRKNKH
jgi:hypothetical protein